MARVNQIRQEREQLWLVESLGTRGDQRVIQNPPGRILILLIGITTGEEVLNQILLDPGIILIETPGKEATIDYPAALQVRGKKISVPHREKIMLLQRLNPLPPLHPLVATPVPGGDL